MRPITGRVDVGAVNDTIAEMTDVIRRVACGARQESASVSNDYRGLKYFCLVGSQANYYITARVVRSFVVL
eukprot:scaffold411917_cov34-Prasinocladus_malaysianus.AAC.2